MDTAPFKTQLEKEKAELEKELASVGRVNPDNPADWEATPEKLDIMQADKNEAADAIEEFEENTAVLRELEIRYNAIKKALEKIEAGTYGTCEVGGEPISEERLQANPAAETCIDHSK